MSSRKFDRYFIQWHITHKCNLRCVHCYQDDYTVSASEDELFSTLNKLDLFLKNNDLKGQINLTGGEPLCHPSFFDLAESIVKRGIILGILTNGTLIDDGTAKRISELHPMFVQVSLDGTAPVHDGIRGAGNYANAIAGIDNLKKYGIKVLVSFTGQKSNIKDFPALAKECFAHSVDKLWWDRVVPDESAESKELALSTQEFVYMLKQTGRLRSKYKNKGLNVDNKRALQFLCSRDKNGYICGAGKNLAVILSDGSVMPCRRLPFVKGVKNDKYPRSKNIGRGAFASDIRLLRRKHRRII